MPERNRLGALVRVRRAAIVGTVTVALLFVAAAATPEGLAFLPGRRPDRIVLPDPPAFAQYLLLGLWMAGAAVYIALRAVALRRRGAERRARGLGGIAALLILLAVALNFPALQRVLDGVFDLRERAGTVGEREPETSPPPDRLRRDSSRTFGWAVTIAPLLAIVAVTIALGRLARRRPVDSRRAAPGALAETLDAGIDDLEAIADPRRAVIACYARMQAAVASSGLERRPADTPFELLARILERYEVDSERARALAVLFERAKFSPHEIDEAMRREALEALVAVRDGLAVPT